MKRFLSVLLALVLSVGLSLPALAAEETVDIRVQEGPVWLGVQEDAGDSFLVYSADQGKTWKAAEPEGVYPYGGVQYTGRDYLLFSAGSAAYTSLDGIHWEALPGRDWLEETARFDPTLNGGLYTREIGLLWTGSEYMMRQKLLEDPRDTAVHYGDGLRNHMVTFLDENYEVIGVKVFDGQVDAIGYENGVYSATVGGETHTFSRSDWDLGQGFGDNYAVGEAGVLRKVYVDNPEGGSLIARFDFAMDGRSWVTVENTPWTTSPEMVSILPSSGKDFFVCNTYSGEIYTSSDGFTWTTHTPVTGTWHSIEGVSSPLRANYTFRRAGSGYLVCQNVFGTGGMYGAGGDTRGPRNHVLTFVDENWNEVWSHDFGAQVLDAMRLDGERDGAWYALVEGTDGAAVWTSEDGAEWTLTELTALPEAPQGDPRFQVRDGRLWASFYGDPAYWVDCGEYELPEGCHLEVRPLVHSWDETYGEAMGLVVEAVDGQGYVYTALTRLLDQGALSREFNALFPTPRYYVTLDGEYLSFDTMPLAQNDRILVPLRGIAEALDFTVTWDQTSNRAVCTKDGTQIAVEIGTANAWVDGEARPQDVASLAQQNRTYVPLRFFSEAFGLNVDWDGGHNTAVLTTAAE